MSQQDDLFRGARFRAPPQEGHGDVLVVVATYNEVENIADLVHAIFDALPNAWLLVIDDNSDASVAEGVTRQDPLLGELDDHGGPTPVLPLLEGSPAIDAGVAEGAPDTDQRGEARSGAPDIGAFEFVP